MLSEAARSIAFKVDMRGRDEGQEVSVVRGVAEVQVDRSFPAGGVGNGGNIGKMRTVD